MIRTAFDDDNIDLVDFLMGHFQISSICEIDWIQTINWMIEETILESHTPMLELLIKRQKLTSEYVYNEFVNQAICNDNKAALNVLVNNKSGSNSGVTKRMIWIWFHIINNSGTRWMGRVFNYISQTSPWTTFVYWSDRYDKHLLSWQKS